MRWCLAAWLLGGTTSVVAQSSGSETPSSQADEAARAHFQVGRLAYDEARYEDALENFQRAYDLSSRPGLLFNIGQAADRLRRDDLAIDAFERYLVEMPDAPNRATVENRLASLRGGSATRGGPTDTESTPVMKKWWFWTIIGAVVVGAVVTGVVVATSGGTSVEEPPAGDVGPGGVVYALGRW